MAATYGTHFMKTRLRGMSPAAIYTHIFVGSEDCFASYCITPKATLVAGSRNSPTP